VLALVLKSPESPAPRAPLQLLLRSKEREERKKALPRLLRKAGARRVHKVRTLRNQFSAPFGGGQGGPGPTILNRYLINWYLGFLE
jgi:hypothetical protein